MAVIRATVGSSQERQQVGATGEHDFLAYARNDDGAATL